MLQTWRSVYQYHRKYHTYLRNVYQTIWIKGTALKQNWKKNLLLVERGLKLKIKKKLYKFCLENFIVKKYSNTCKIEKKNIHYGLHHELYIFKSTTLLKHWLDKNNIFNEHLIKIKNVCFERLLPKIWIFWSSYHVEYRL